MHVPDDASLWIPNPPIENALERAGRLFWRGAGRATVFVALLLALICNVTNAQTRVYAVDRGPYADSQGKVWAPDALVVSPGTNLFSVTDPIAGTLPGTSDQALYQNSRWAENFTETFSLPNGDYTVVLKFAELWANSVGQRVFDVSINGSKVLSDFDLYATAGPDVAVDKVFPVTVTGGQIVVSFAATQNNATIGAIEILPAQSSGPITVVGLPPGCTYSVSADQKTVTVSGCYANPPALATIACPVGAHEITLSWLASTTADVTSYNVYRGAQTGGPYTKIANTTGLAYTDSGLSAGRYFYVVTTLNGNGESVYSNEAVAIIP